MAALSEEQTIIKDQAKSWVTEQSPVGKFRTLRDEGRSGEVPENAWSAMVELGWTGILVPEKYGGSDLGYMTFGVILEELGRHLVVSPLFASALAGTSAILLGGDDAQKQAILPEMVKGHQILTLAVDEGTRHAPERIAMTATASGNGFRLSGRKTMALEGLSATTFVVAARTAGSAGDRDGITLFLVPSDAAGLHRSALQTIDSRGYAEVTFDAVEVAGGAVLGPAGEGFALLDQVLDRARAGLGAEMLGTAAQAFEMTLDYLKTREQFGKVIGSFQALGHRAAQLYSGMEMARSCVEAALEGIDRDSVDIASLCSLSKAKMGGFLFDMSNELIQIHGGIGMTDEFDAGLYLKRARVLETIYGNRAFHRDRYAKLLGF